MTFNLFYSYNHLWLGRIALSLAFLTAFVIMNVNSTPVMAQEIEVESLEKAPSSADYIIEGVTVDITAVNRFAIIAVSIHHHQHLGLNLSKPVKHAVQPKIR